MLTPTLHSTYHQSLVGTVPSHLIKLKHCAMHHNHTNASKASSRLSCQARILALVADSGLLTRIQPASPSVPKNTPVVSFQTLGTGTRNPPPHECVPKTKPRNELKSATSNSFVGGAESVRDAPRVIAGGYRVLGERCWKLEQRAIGWVCVTSLAK
jgi:hypothetical protein